MAALLSGKTPKYDPTQPTIIVPKCPAYSPKLQQMVTKDGKMCAPTDPDEPRVTRQQILKSLRSKARSKPQAAGAKTAFDNVLMVPKCPAGSQAVSREEYMRYERTAGDQPILDATGQVCITYQQAVKDLLQGKLVENNLTTSRSQKKLERDEFRVLAKLVGTPPGAQP